MGSLRDRAANFSLQGQCAHSTITLIYSTFSFGFPWLVQRFELENLSLLSPGPQPPLLHTFSACT